MAAIRFRSRCLLPLAAGSLLGGTATAQTLLYNHTGSNTYDRLGASCSPIGDIDGDNRIDYAGGAPENFQIILADEGYVRLYSGATGALIKNINGVSSREGFGEAVAAAGDVNGDMIPDIIVGAPTNSESGTLRGQARVFSGAGPAYTLLYEIEGDANNDEYGFAVSGAGDTNNDGRDDFMIGGRGSDINGNNSGVVRVYNGMNGQVLHTFMGTSNDRFLGASLASLGDINNDGHDDVLVGSYFDGARVYSGLNGQLLHIFPNPSNDDFLGYSVSALQDINNDGVTDILVGATEDSVLGAGPGYARVFSGANGQTLLTVNGGTTGDRFGISVTGLDDWDGDGTPDFAVGADENQSDGVGYVQVFSGANGALLHTFTGQGSQTRLGTWVAGLGDVDGDGKTELAIGEPGASPSGLASGELHIYSGQPGGISCAAPQNYCLTSPNSAGSGAIMDTAGSTSITDNNLILLTAGCPPNENGLYFYGPNQIQFPFGDGFRCVGAGGAAIFRLGVIDTGPVGLAILQLDHDNLPTSGGLDPLEITNFQFWYRDPGFGNFGFNLSDAIEVQFCP